MVLHSHAVNEAREARGEPAVNSVWFWGGGRVPRVATERWHSVSADEPLALGLARAAAMRDGRLGMITIHVPDAAECLAYETIRGDLRRFWRRPRALEHYA